VPPGCSVCYCLRKIWRSGGMKLPPAAAAAAQVTDLLRAKRAAERRPWSWAGADADPQHCQPGPAEAPDPPPSGPPPIGHSGLPAQQVGSGHPMIFIANWICQSWLPACLVAWLPSCFVPGRRWERVQCTAGMVSFQAANTNRAAHSLLHVKQL